MSAAIPIDPVLRQMSYHGPARFPSRGRRRGTTFFASVSTFAIALGWSGTLNMPQGFSTAFAASALPAAFADLEPMSDQALEAARGGFSVGNVDVHVGVTVQTSIDGFVNVTTNFTVAMPGMLENMGTEIKSVTDAAAQAANAAVDAANAAIQAANAATAQTVNEAVAGATGNTGGGTPPPANGGDTVTVGSVTGTSQHVNGQPVSTPPAATSPATDGGSLSASPAVKGATDALAQGVQQATANLQTAASPPPSVTPPATTPAPVPTPAPGAAYNDSLAGAGAPPPSAPPSTPASTSTAAPVVSVIAVADPASGGTATQQPASVKVVGTSKNGDTLIVPANAGNMAQIIHDATQGHTTVITNTLNNVTIRQTVSMNMTVENFTALQNISSLNRTVTSLSRQIGLLGLRH